MGYTLWVYTGVQHGFTSIGTNYATIQVKVHLKNE